MASHKREPIKHTCPDIDGYIKSIKRELTEERHLKRLEPDEVLKAASDMSCELENCIDYLESLRDANHILREWGIEEADKADDLTDKVEELEMEIEALKEKIRQGQRESVPNGV